MFSWNYCAEQRLFFSHLYSGHFDLNEVHYCTGGVCIFPWLLLLLCIDAHLYMRYVPSPVPVPCEWVYSAMTNKSGRMQYHKIKPGKSKLRISRNEFIRAYNSAQIIALKPLQVNGNDTDFQLEFYV